MLVLFLFVVFGNLCFDRFLAMSSLYILSCLILFHIVPHCYPLLQLVSVITCLHQNTHAVGISPKWELYLYVDIASQDPFVLVHLSEPDYYNH